MLTIEKLIKILPNIKKKQIKNTSSQNICIQISYLDLIPISQILKKYFEQLIDITVIDYLNEKSAERFQIVYQFLSFKEEQRLTLKYFLPNEVLEIQSLASLWSIAAYYEREVHEMFGLQINDHPNLKPLLLGHGLSGYPLRKDFQNNYLSQDQLEYHEQNLNFNHKSLTQIEYGLNHSFIRGPLKLLLTLDGEKIVNIETEIGYAHRGFEKEVESKSYLQIIPYVDRLNCTSSIIYGSAFAMAIEKLCQLEVSKRDEYARIILSEIMRMIDHFTCLSNWTLNLGIETTFMWFMKAREFLLELIEEFTGARFTPAWNRFGTNAIDFPDGFLPKLTDRLHKVEHVLHESHTLLNKNRIFIDRLKNIGIINQSKAINYGFSGVALRASGIAHDLRVFQGGYSLYHEFDFEIPIGSIGDCYDRYLVRIEEITQSIHIIQQAHDKLAHNSTNITNLLDPKPFGEIYQPVEGANGEFAFYLVANNTNFPQRLHVKTPIMNYIAALNEMTWKSSIDDLTTIINSMNIVIEELDR